MIPRKVIGKFSIRLVPDQQPDEIEKQASVPNGLRLRSLIQTSGSFFATVRFNELQRPCSSLEFRVNFFATCSFSTMRFPCFPRSHDRRIATERSRLEVCDDL